MSTFSFLILCVQACLIFNVFNTCQAAIVPAVPGAYAPAYAGTLGCGCGAGLAAPCGFGAGLAGPYGYGAKLAGPYGLGAPFAGPYLY